MIITLNVNHITAQVEQKCEIQVFMEDGTTDEELEKAHEEILKNSNVRTAELFTKEDTLKMQKQSLGLHFLQTGWCCFSCVSG